MTKACPMQLKVKFYPAFLILAPLLESPGSYLITT